jgi:tetratricopeptide (TPR) repeat protein
VVHLRIIAALVAAVALGCTFFTTAAAAQSDAANCSSGDPDRMIAGCSAIINRPKGLPQKQLAMVYCNRGVANYVRGDLDKALADYNRALQYDDKYTDAWLNRADLKLRKGDLAAAIGDYRKVIGLDPTRSSAYNGLGNALREGGNVDQAIPNYEKAIQLTPESPLAYNGRATALLDKGEIEAAIHDYDRAIELNPRYATALVGRGNALRDAGRRAEAIRDYDAAIVLDPNDATAYSNRGTTYKDEGQFDRAIEDYNVAIDHDPKRATFYFNRALAYVGKDQADLAISDYSRTIDIDKNHAFAYHNRGLLFFEKHDFDQAISDYKNAIRINPKYAQYYCERGIAYLRKGDIANAVKDLEQSVKLDNREPAANMALAEAYEKQQKYIDAEAQLDRAIALDPGSPAAFIQRGRVRESLKKFEQATKDYETAGSLDSELADLVREALAAIKSKVTGGPEPAGDSKPVPTPLNRVALVIGNSNYAAAGRLPNAAPDARAVADAFRQIGFREVMVVSDQTREGMLASLKRFGEIADAAEWAVIYYAGHGMQIEGVNYMVPSNARLVTDRDVPDEAVPLSRFLDYIRNASQFKLVILDACRDNPFLSRMKLSSATRSIERGLRRIEPKGARTLVAYAALDGQVALDGHGEHSPYVTSLVRELLTPGLDIVKLFGRVHDDVFEATDGKQEPSIYFTPGGTDFIINPGLDVRIGDSKL